MMGEVFDRQTFLLFIWIWRLNGVGERIPRNF